MLPPRRVASAPRAVLTALSAALLGSLVFAGTAGAVSVPGDEGQVVTEAAPPSVWPPVPGVVFAKEAPVVHRVAARVVPAVDVVEYGSAVPWFATGPTAGTGQEAAEQVQPPPAPPVPPAPVAVRMVQANIKSSLSAAAFTSDLGEVVASGPDFVTLNEVPRRSDDQIAPDGYAAYRGIDSTATRETPVLWRTDRWRQVAVGTRYLTTRQVQWGVRAVNWVTVQNLATGDVVSVVSAHPAPTIPATRGLLPEFMTGLAGLVRELGARGSVLVGGDLNMGYHGPLWTGAALESARLAATYDVFGVPPGGTGDHGGATIDYVLFQRDNGLTPTAQGTAELYSDHDAVWADFLLG